MPSRPKTPKPPPLHERAARSMRAHPIITWASVASIVGVLAVIVPAVLWVDARYQSAAAADAHIRDHRQERGEILYQLARQESLILRNRLNDCSARTKESPQQRAACDQYRLDYREAQQRERVLYEQMQRAK